MNTNLIPFQFEGHELRVVRFEDGSLSFVAKDVALAIGKTDDFFLQKYLSCTDALFCYRLAGDFDESRSLEWMEFISKVGYMQKDYSLFVHAYRSSMISLLWRSGITEETIMSKFRSNVGSYIKGSSIVDGPKTKLHIPDAWIKLDSGEVCPVEGKKTKADRKALEQLLRYMRVFSSKTGILVAQTLTTFVPDNVIYVEVQL